MKKYTSYTKAELISEIECLKNNIEVLKEREDRSFRMLTKLDEYLRNKGLSHSEITKIIEL